MANLEGVKVGDRLRSAAFLMLKPQRYTDTVARVTSKEVIAQSGVRFTRKKGLCITNPTYRYTCAAELEATNENA